jgi:cytochrome P450
VDQAVINVLSSTTRYAQKALDRAIEEEKHAGKVDEEKRPYSFLDEMARQTQDLERMSHEATSLMFAGKDTTAGLLGSMWYLLARHPEVWNKLLAEVDQLEGAPPTYEWVKNAKYLRYCEHEGKHTRTFSRWVK